MLEWSAQILFPPVCAGCRRHVSQPGVLCAQCWPRLRFLERPWCPVMGTPFAHEMGEEFLCGEALADPPPFERCRSAVSYHGVACDMVRGLKYHDRTDLAPWMAVWMARAGRELLAEADMIVPVPLYWQRFFKRRFNQSAELARALAKLAERPFEPSIVRRQRQTRPQVGLKLRERQDNLRGAFQVGKPERLRIGGRRVLLVDDVYTTGATVRAVALTLKRAGAGAVDVLTFARVLADADAGDFQPETTDLI
ncbi:double zinc ribbon domain-containing protein [Aquamicrobium segne]|uniref:Double zinc ribbon domain-containing protein n=1 Tax=Aquamicrobium segne TaxID=469547 RepID=A0ABW0H1J2_9HYPH